MQEEYTLDMIMLACDCSVAHRARLCKRILAEDYGLIKYTAAPKSDLRLTKPSYEYWVRKILARKPKSDPTGKGYVYAFFAQSHRYVNGILMRFVKIGRTQDTRKRFRGYTGPEAIGRVIKIQAVDNMVLREAMILGRMINTEGFIRVRQEWFLVPIHHSSDNIISGIVTNIAEVQ